MLIRPWLVHQWFAQLSRSAGRTLIIRGPWASAKSDYLVHAAEHYVASVSPSEKSVLTFSGKRLLSTVPGAALTGARWLTGPGDSDAEHADGDAPQVRNARLVAIDDVQHLDEASAREVVDAAAQGEVSVIATLLAGTSLPEPFRMLLRQGNGEVVDLPLLNGEEIRRAATDILGGAPDEETLELLSRWTAGRPRWIVAALDWLVQQGHIAESDSGWRLAVAPRPSEFPESERFLGFLSELDPAAKQLVGTLASWGPTTSGPAAAEFGTGALKALLAMQIVEVFSATGAQTSRDPAHLSLRVSGELLAAAVHQRSVGPESTPGERGRSDSAERVQRLFLDLDFERATELESHVVDAAQVRDVRTAKLLAELVTGRWEEVSVTFAELTAETGRGAPGSPEETGSPGAPAAPESTGSPKNPIAGLFDVGLERADNLHIGSKSTAQFLRSARQHLAEGDLHAARHEAEWVLAASGSDRLAAQEWAAFMARSQFLAVELLAADWASATSLISARATRAERAWQADRGTIFAARALTRMFQGFYADALIDAQHAVESLTGFDPFYIRPLAGAVGLHAISRLRGYRQRDAASQADPSDQSGVKDPGRNEPSGTGSVSDPSAADEARLAAALEPLWWADSSYPFLDLTLGVLSATEGGQSVAAARVNAQQELQTPLSRAISAALAGGVKTAGVKAASAKAGGTKTGTIKTNATESDTFSPTGPSWVHTVATYKRRLRSARGLAAILDIADEAASRNLLRVQQLAHELALKRGYDAPAIVAAHQRVIRIQREGIATLSTSNDAIHVDTLTDREREIATIAAKNHSSAAIASRLGVSVRTVEGHLQRAYQKLGVHTRAHLARALDATTITFGSHITETKPTPDGSDPLEYAPRLLGNST